MAHNSYIWLNLSSLSYKKSEAILNYFASGNELWEADEKSLANIPPLGEEDIQKLKNTKMYVEKEQEIARKNNITIVDITEEGYPDLLKEISSPPLVLYIKGKKEILKQFLFAIVGTRTPTLYGLRKAEEFSYFLSLRGWVITSGLARGIDTAAHKGALKCGLTVAVLGSGLLNIYPKENRKLAQQIWEKGAVVSEFPLTTPPLRENFPRRNRIVSGLSRGVLVVEAGIRSGALITAHLACEQGREVFAIPGDIDSPLSKGTNNLIREGAILVKSPYEIISEFNYGASDICIKNDNKLKVSFSDQENKVFSAIGEKEVHLEEIIRKTSLSYAEVNKTILTLQLAGIIKEVKPLHFAKNII